LADTTTGSAGKTTTTPSETQSGIGLTQGTTAERGAWILYRLRLNRSTTGSRDSLMLMCPTFGHLVVCATLMAVTGRTFSQRTSTVGSGQPIRQDYHQQMELPSMTGLLLEGFNHLRSSRTTENRFNRVESPNRAWLCSTTFMATASSGTMLPVIMRSQ